MSPRLASIRAQLIAAGIAAYAIQECDGPNGPCLSVRFDDIPEEGVSARLDAAIRDLKPDASDKGLIFGMEGEGQ